MATLNCCTFCVSFLNTDLYQESQEAVCTEDKDNRKDMMHDGTYFDCEARENQLTRTGF